MAGLRYGHLSRPFDAVRVPVARRTSCVISYGPTESDAPQECRVLLFIARPEVAAVWEVVFKTLGGSGVGTVNRNDK